MNPLAPKFWRRRASFLVLATGLLGAASAASAQSRLSLADLAAQIDALRLQVTSLTQANSNLQGQIDSLNANLGVVQIGIAGAQVKAQDAQSRVAIVEGGLAAVQANSVLALDGILAYDAAAHTARFSGVDVQILNGQGAGTINGRGNLIVGYNERRIRPAVCSFGGSHANSQVACESIGGVWSANHKSGSHNLVVGDGHAYSSHGGVLFGFGNTVVSYGGSVTGGTGNVVLGTYGAVSGGVENWARAPYSAIGGGYQNSTDALYSVVSGGATRSTGPTEDYSWRGGGLSQPQ